LNVEIEKIEIKLLQHTWKR